MTSALNDSRTGHSLAEYCAMFALGEAERRTSILTVGDGPSSFNAEGTVSGMRIVSVDPLYALHGEQVAARIAHTSPVVGRFLEDYSIGVDQGRYVSGDATALPFPDGSYDLALCSHLLFRDGQPDDLAFHLRAVNELLRVAEEVRIFPVMETGAATSRHLRAVMMALERQGFRAETREADQDLQLSGRQMLVIAR